MYYPNVEETNNTREMISHFLGYNHNLVIDDGELYDMKNLSADRYPLLAPRQKRNVKMQLKNTEWDSIDTTITYEYHGTIQEAYIEYKTGDVSIEEKKKIKVSFEIDTDKVAECIVTVIYSGGGVTIDATTYETEEDFSEIMFTPEGTDTIQIIVNAYAIDPNDFDPSGANTYMHDFVLGEYNEGVRGILCKGGKLAYVIGQYLYYDNESYDIRDLLPEDDDRKSRLKLISFGAYILIFPYGIYLNTQDPDDMGWMGCMTEISGDIAYSLCNASGEAYMAVVSDTAPDSPQDGDYWLKVDGDVTGLYQWYDSLKMWNGIATTYIKISIPEDITDEYSEGDAVFLNTKLEDINEGSVIRAIGTELGGSYIVVTGIMDKTTDTETFTTANPFIVDRRIPDLDYVCVSQNRVWGCHYGVLDGEMVNEIYASKLGDFKNWYVFDGTAADSYALSMGDDGEFTGAVTYQGYPMFLKENNIYRIYGQYPANYQLYTYNCRGVQKGSDRSIAIVGEYLVYKSLADICVFDGSSPVSISAALGNINYHDAVGGAGLNKYYVSLVDEDDNTVFFVYDFRYGTWYKEDDLRIEEFTYNQSGKLYGQSGQKIYGFGMAVNEFDLEGEEEESDVEWMAETGDLALSSPDHKYPGRITIKAHIPFGGEIKVFTSNDEGVWRDENIITGTGKVKSYSITPAVLRSDTYRLRLEGHKDVRIYSITRTYSEGSETE